MTDIRGDQVRVGDRIQVCTGGSWHRVEEVIDNGEFRTLQLPRGWSVLIRADQIIEVVRRDALNGERA